VNGFERTTHGCAQSVRSDWGSCWCLCAWLLLSDGCHSIYLHTGPLGCQLGIQSLQQPLQYMPCRAKKLRPAYGLTHIWLFGILHGCSRAAAEQRVKTCVVLSVGFDLALFWLRSRLVFLQCSCLQGVGLVAGSPVKLTGTGSRVMHATKGRRPAAWHGVLVGA
jgi:hypothetical protein